MRSIDNSQFIILVSPLCKSIELTTQATFVTASELATAKEPLKNLVYNYYFWTHIFPLLTLKITI